MKFKKNIKRFTNFIFYEKSLKIKILIKKKVKKSYTSSLININLIREFFVNEILFLKTTNSIIKILIIF